VADEIAVAVAVTDAAFVCVRVRTAVRERVGGGDCEAVGDGRQLKVRE
jgi:hypothetical protein